MPAAAKEKTFEPDTGLLAQLSQNSHQGHQLSTAVSHPAFGPAISQTPTGLANHLYDFGVGPRCSGYFRDSESGNDYADQRYTSPGMGRFITPDTISGNPSNPGTWNLYAYVAGDPINFVDRHGTTMALPYAPAPGDPGDDGGGGCYDDGDDTCGGLGAGEYCGGGVEPFVSPLCFQGGGGGGGGAPSQQPTCEGSISSALSSVGTYLYVVLRVLNDNSFGLGASGNNLLNEDIGITSVLANRAAYAASGGTAFNLAAGGSSNINNQALYAYNPGNPNGVPAYGNVNNLINSTNPLSLNSQLCQNFLQDISLAVQAVTDVTGSPSSFLVQGLYYWFASSYTPTSPLVGQFVTTINNTSFYGKN